MALTEEEKKKIKEEEDFRASIRAENPKSEKRKKGKSKRWLFLITFILLIYVLGSHEKEELTPEQEAIKKEEIESKYCNKSNPSAYRESQAFVKSVLKSPSTAKFPSYNSGASVSNIGDCKYQVNSYVDSQNTFGAMIRSNYQAVVQYSGNERWSLIDIKLDN